MKAQLKIFMAILITILMTSPINASNFVDNKLKIQCQYLVYGEGKPNDFYNMYLMGVISGIQYMIADPTEFTYNAKDGVKVNKACQNALKNIGENGFASDFKWQATKLMSKEYSK